MEGLVGEVAGKLPLAEAVLRTLGYVCDSNFLQDVFDRYRGRSYERKLSFPLMVQLIGDALQQHNSSGHRSFQRADESGELDASLRAVYGKLGRIPATLSVGFFGETVGRIQELLPDDLDRSHIPGSLQSMEVIVYDGKTLKNVAHRLSATRSYRGKLLGGRLVLAQSLTTRMVVGMAAHEDGESGEQPLTPAVVAQVREAISGPRLHMADRAYCDLNLTGLFTQNGDHFIVRWHKKIKFHRDEAWESLTGTDRYGREYVEDWGWIGSEDDPRRRYVRRIHLKRGKQEDVILLTDLHDSEQYPADDLLEAYLMRWSIEQMIQQVTEVFHLGDLIGTTPRATLFQASFCLLLFNLIILIRSYIAQGQKTPESTISAENLFYDVQRQLIAWTEILSTEQTLHLISTTQTPSQLRRRLKQLLHSQWSSLWNKAPSNTHKSTPKRDDEFPPSGHNSVFRLLHAANHHR